MGRPKKKRQISCKPCCSCFKPEGSSRKDLPGVDLLTDELTALKLHDVDGLNQSVASAKMKISQPTFARILASAHKKISSAIVTGDEIRIN